MSAERSTPKCRYCGCEFPNEASLKQHLFDGHATPSVFLSDADVTLHHGDALDILNELPTDWCDACVTSPPYLDARPEYPSPSLQRFSLIFEELRRVVSGPLLLNVGRLWREKCEDMWWLSLLNRARLAGWELRDTLIWVKPNANPIHGQILANSHEYVFVFGDGCTPDEVRTDYDEESLARFTRRYRNGTGVKGEERGQEGREANELGARARSFFIGYVGREKGNPHPAPMAEALADHLIRLSGGRIILDPFAGSGTTLVVARRLGRMAVGIEQDETYCDLASERLAQQTLFAGAA